jgi:hypothetical protein
MSDMLLGDLGIVKARVVLPRIGVWYAELTVDADTVPSGVQVFRTEDGALTLTGLVRADRSAMFAGRAEVLLIGGRDGLSTLLEPREYSDPTVRILLEDICRETGEQLSSDIDSGLLSGTLARWTRGEVVAGSAVAAVANALGVSWRILNDGTLWLGQELWPNVEIPGDVIDERPRHASWELQVETLFATIAPGTTWDGRQVSIVEHRATADQASTLAWFEPATPRDPTARDRLKSGLDALIANVTRGSQYHALYPATVLGQSGDGSVDVQPDSPALPALVQVPLRATSPGTIVKVSSGARCLVAFEDGSAQGPVVVAWANSDKQTEHTFDVPTLKIGTNATRGIARMNDEISRNAALAAWMTSVQGALTALMSPIPPFAGSTIGTVSSASGRGKCD